MRLLSTTVRKGLVNLCGHQGLHMMSSSSLLPSSSEFFPFDTSLLHTTMPNDLVESSSIALDLPDSTSFFLSNGANAWSVSANDAESASSLFAISLFPYLALLYFLAAPSVRTPKGANFGFQFLLVFVFATIPAGIYAKVAYHDILANIDWLHGSAESMLTVTNLLIVFGLKEARNAFIAKQQEHQNDDNDDMVAAPTSLPSSSSSSAAATEKLFDASLPLTMLLLATSVISTGAFPLAQAHIEPLNALSIPTWMVHVSSLLEWLVAMQLIWEHSIVSGNPRWKGLTIGMIPSHTSGLCACTYHLFYNAPELNWLVALQALLTVVGNSTMAFAAYRIWQWEKEQGWYNARGTEREIEAEIDRLNIQRDSIELSILLEKEMETSVFVSNNGVEKTKEEEGTTVLGDAFDDSSNKSFVLKMFTASVVLSLLVKYGELYSDAPFAIGEMSQVAALCIFLPTILNISKWAIRSKNPESTFLSLF